MLVVVAVLIAQSLGHLADLLLVAAGLLQQGQRLEVGVGHVQELGGVLPLFVDDLGAQEGDALAVGGGDLKPEILRPDQSDY